MFKKYSYIKGPVTYITPPAKEGPATKTTSKKKSSKLKLISPILITLGSIAIANVVWPLLSHQIFVSPSIQKVDFASPVAKEYIGSVPNTPQSQTSDSNTPQVMGSSLDYTNAKNWFPMADFALNEPITTYTIDIPTLEIENALVIIGGEDLREGLIQYPGTAKPGQFGAPVVFGHSTLRQFYNPSENNSDRYVSIFSKVMTLKNRDRIYVDYDSIRYTYEVVDKVEVEPEDLFILEQHLNNKMLKLITCVPEGTYLRRGVILAQLVNLTDSSEEE